MFEANLDDLSQRKKGLDVTQYSTWLACIRTGEKWWREAERRVG